MINQQIEFLVKLRDASLMIADAADGFLKSLTPPELGLENPEPAKIDEMTFTTLRWEAQKGAKLGDFDIACKTSNIQDKWQHAFNILQNSNATIKDRYLGENYSHSYWIYGSDKIYRQEIKRPTYPQGE